MKVQPAGSSGDAPLRDVNSDGKKDIVFSCEGAKGELSGMRWLSWTNSPTEKIWKDYEIAGEPGIKYDRVVMHDIDGDGDLDALCCEERRKAVTLTLCCGVPLNT